MSGYAVYLVARGLIAGLCRLPLRAGLVLGRFGGGLAFSVLRIRRGVVLTNLRYVFGGQRTEREIRALAHDAYRQFGMNVVEAARAAVADPEEGRRLVEIPAFEELARLQAAGEPLIVCSPHAGSFDRMGCAAAARGLEIYVMMRALKSPRFHELLVASRERVGMHVLVKGEESFHEMFDLLERGKTVALLPDQNARRGVTVDFLGKPASTFQGPAVLHLVTGARVVVAVNRRRRDDYRRHEVHVRFLPRYEPTRDRKRDIREVTQRICDAMSEEILKEPGQYFWLHRRWGKRIAAPADHARPAPRKRGGCAGPQVSEDVLR